MLASKYKAARTSNAYPSKLSDETALPTAGGFAWAVNNGAIGPTSDTGLQIALAIFGEASWQHFHLLATVNPQGGRAGVAVAVAGTPPGSRCLVFLIDETAARLRVIRRDAGLDIELTAVALPTGLSRPFVLEVTAYDDAWHASVGTAEVRLPRDRADSGRLALAVGGVGHILDLCVDPLDVYRFEFRTSRYVDFAAHIASWSGAVATLPQIVSPTSEMSDLVVRTPISELMRPGSDPQRRQRAFDEWTRDLAILLRREIERLEISARASSSGVDLLLFESPEPLPFSEDVRVDMDRIEPGGARTHIRIAVLSDGNELRAYGVPLSDSGVPIELNPGEYRSPGTLGEIVTDRAQATAVMCLVRKRR